MPDAKAAKAQEQYQRELAVGMHKPKFPMQQEALKFKPNNKLTDDEEAKAFHRRIDDILGKPVELPKQEAFNQSKKSFSKTRERTLSKTSLAQIQPMNATNQSFSVLDSQIAQLHLKSPLNSGGADLPASLVQLLTHLQKAKQYQPAKPKIKSKMVERAFEHL